MNLPDHHLFVEANAATNSFWRILNNFSEIINVWLIVIPYSVAGLAGIGWNTYANI